MQSRVGASITGWFLTSIEQHRHHFLDGRRSAVLIVRM